jgi:hypothetical protein
MSKEQEKLDSLGRMDELDRLLDRALASYTPEDVLPGMEERIVETARVEVEPHGWSWKPAWAWAAAALLVAVTLSPLWRKVLGPFSGGIEPQTAVFQEPRVEAPRQQLPAQMPNRMQSLKRPGVAAREEAGLARIGGMTGQKRLKRATEADLSDADLSEDDEGRVVNSEPVEFKPITIVPIQIRALR